jgi:hypothetical protein
MSRCSPHTACAETVRKPGKVHVVRMRIASSVGQDAAVAACSAVLRNADYAAAHCSRSTVCSPLSLQQFRTALCHGGADLNLPAAVGRVTVPPQRLLLLPAMLACLPTGSASKFVCLPLPICGATRRVFYLRLLQHCRCWRLRRECLVLS